MPYLVRSKGLKLKMRDIESNQIVDVLPVLWSRFEKLPPGVSPQGDHQLEIHEIVQDPMMAEQKAETPQEPEKRRGRRKVEEE